jgi:transcriptional regulator with XRE-family HTH domain
MSRALRDLRTRSGISKTDAAEKIGVHFVTLYAWENENRADQPSAENLAKAAKAYGTTIWLSTKARRCSYGDKAMGRIDDRWGRYVNGSQTVTFPIVGNVTVARNVPFDGAVSNERSSYPGLTDPNFNLPPVLEANHMNVYKRRAGVNTIADAMIRIGMTQVGPIN